MSIILHRTGRRFPLNTSATVNPIITDGVVLYLDGANYKSGTTWFDLGPYGNNGILTNSPTFINSGGGALSFNGTNNILFSSPSNIPSGNTLYTIFSWVYPTVNDASSHGIIGWGTFGSAGQVTALKLGGTTITNYWWGIDLTAENFTATNKWYNIVATYNGTSRKIYSNNVVIGSDSPGGHNVVTTSNLSVGSSQSNGTEPFNGYIAIVLVYNRGLSTSEIANMYNTTKSRFGY